MLIWCFCLFLWGEGQQATSVSPEPRPASVSSDTLAAQAWLLAAYPELSRKLLVVEGTGAGGHHRLTVSEASADAAPSAVSQRTPLLHVDAHFTREGVLERLVARGVAVATPRLEALRAWTSARARSLDEIETEVRRSGGEYGPSAASAIQLRAQRLAGLRRDASTVVRMGFESTAGIGPAWVVEVQGARRTYRAVFEPSTGQLIAVSPK